MFEKKCKYNEAMLQLFIDFKKAYDSVRGEVLYTVCLKSKCTDFPMDELEM
jgi:hypothetical protein